MSKRDDHKATYYSGKKPYLVHNYRTMMKKKTQEEYYFHELNVDPMSELLQPYQRHPDIPGFGWEYMAPNFDWNFPPYDYPGWGYPDVDCQLACNDSMLDCEGGCTTIACICAVEPIIAVIAWDDTGGNAYIGGSTPSGVIVCIKDSTESGITMEYPTVGVTITDARGGEYTVRVAVVDCLQCCEPFTLTGDDTVNAGTTWVGTISPACPGAT